jgi:hypothetical protein
MVSRPTSDFLLEDSCKPREEKPVSSKPYQARVFDWEVRCFGEADALDQKTRRQRFLEEALELVQACGMPRTEAHEVLNYVYNRPVGDAYQEVGGTMVSLAALCAALPSVDLETCAETELARVEDKIEMIRKRHAAKPKFGLPPPRIMDSGGAGVCVVGQTPALGKTVGQFVEYLSYHDKDLPLGINVGVGSNLVILSTYETSELPKVLWIDMGEDEE